MVEGGADGYRVHAAGCPLWVNGERCSDRLLAPGDLLELCEVGWLLRLRAAAVPGRPYKRLRDALGDCVDCARHGGRGLAQRAWILLRGGLYEFTTQVSPRVRFATVGLLLLLALAVVGLYRRNAALEHQLERQVARLEGLEQLLQRSEREALSAAQMAELQGRLGERIDEALARVETLEQRAGARATVIREAAGSVIFLQGGYGFTEPNSGRTLRRTGPDEAPVLTLDEEGEPVEILYTGTGFVVGDEGYVLTNRHVATPWEFDELGRALTQRGLVPVMHRFLGYLPDVAEPFPLRLVRAHPDADVALLRCDASVTGLQGLSLAPELPALGTEVIVLGYPTGMRALLARAAPELMRRLTEQGTVGFWQLAEQLARARSIEPLATVGVVGQVTATHVVYDAETTHGGSGGPVLTLDGRVVAINAAVVPEFGGSNLGVPAARAVELLAATGSAAR